MYTIKLASQSGNGACRTVVFHRINLTNYGRNRYLLRKPMRYRDQRSHTSSMTKSFSSAPTSSFDIRRLEADDVAGYRELRLEGLRSHPEAFASCWESEAEKPPSWWAERLKSSVVLGGRVDGSPLVGVAGLR